jgi:hypothetical protein
MPEKKKITINKNNVRDITGDPRIIAAIDLVGRTGASEFQFRFSNDEPPTVWMAIAKWDKTWDVGAGIDPAIAIFRLLDQVIDGGTCTHCERPTGFEESTDPMPLDEFVCWYQWDPELKVFRRGCDGSDEFKDQVRKPTSPLDI